MKKLAVSVIVAIAISSSLSALAKQPKDESEKTRPAITVATDCIRASDGVEVTKFFAEGLPNMKNELLAQAIIIADFQVSCDAVDLKESCAVTRTTTSEVKHVVYEAVAEECGG